MNLTDDQFRAWMTALRSGEWEQGRASLIRFVVPPALKPPLKIYCCMGVLGAAVLNLPYIEMVGIGYLSAFDPPRVLEYAEEQVLSYLNDQLSLTFPQIAAFIEGGGMDLYRVSGGRLLPSKVPS